jgi:acetyltransferase-like isoleucine patch superfamily enzyme
MRRRVRDVAQRLLSRVDALQRRFMEIHHGDPLAERFLSFGKGSRIQYPWLEMVGPKNIEIGEDVFIRSYGSFEVLGMPGTPLLRIGDRVQIGHSVRFVAVNGIFIGADAGVGHGSTVTDTIHDYKGVDEGQAMWRAPLKLGRPLNLEEGCWVGNNCVVTGGITVGAGAIVGANSVINRDVPAETIVMGNPARLVRRKTAKGWEWLIDPATLELELTQTAEDRQG